LCKNKCDDDEGDRQQISRLLNRFMAGVQSTIGETHIQPAKIQYVTVMNGRHKMIIRFAVTLFVWIAELYYY
jgi:hypothetical protein